MPSRCIPPHLSSFLLAFSLFSLSPNAPAQMAHNGPAKAIALAKTLQPFDVISIRQNNTGANSGNYDIDDVHAIFTMDNMPLEALIGFAYDIKPQQIAGLTGPVSTARFNLTAKVLPPGGGPPQQLPDANLQAMTILLLEDRFHLKAHLQPKVMSVYDLVLTHGGLKIKLSQDEIHDSHWSINGANTEKILSGKNTSLTDLAEELSDLGDRKVIDKTGLTGHADITLKWSDDVALTQNDPNAISIFTAVEEQLGLKLQPSKGPIDTLIIEHIEMPTEN
jgi:bla regulator protein blaR1